MYKRQIVILRVEISINLQQYILNLKKHHRSVKRCLKKSLGRKSLTFEELETILIDIEATLNSRPLTYIYDEQEGVSYPLTPSCLINGRRIPMTPNDAQFEISCTNKFLTKRARYQNRIPVFNVSVM